MTKNILKIIFMGTPDFSVSALDKLVKSKHEVVAVYTQPPRPKGRGHKLQPSPVHEYAERSNIPVYTPQKLKKNPNAIEEFESLEADVAVVAAYGLILPKEILNAPKYGCLNIHASLLPRWRGAAPIQYAIWKGDDKSGVTIMQMEEGLDTGPMISEQEVVINDNTTAKSLHDDLAEIGSSMIVGVLDELAENQALSGQTQDDTLSNYASMLTKEDGKVDWHSPAIEVDRQIRALNPWPGAFFQKDGVIFKVKKARYLLEKSEEKPGTIFSKDGYVSCSDNTTLQLINVQTPNGKTMNIEAAINGGYLNIGDVLS